MAKRDRIDAVFADMNVVGRTRNVRGATAKLRLTFHLDHSLGADQSCGISLSPVPPQTEQSKQPR